jgi:molybdopterin converting factor small subunit
MRIKVRYLGAFAEATHVKQATYELDASSIDALTDYLVKQNGEKFRALMLDPATGKFRSGLTVLVNGERIVPHQVLADNDEVTLLTPLAGG